MDFCLRACSRSSIHALLHILIHPAGQWSSKDIRHRVLRWEEPDEVLTECVFIHLLPSCSLERCHSCFKRYLWVCLDPSSDSWGFGLFFLVHLRCASAVNDSLLTPQNIQRWDTWSNWSVDPRDNSCHTLERLYTAHSWLVVKAWWNTITKKLLQFCRRINNPSFLLSVRERKKFFQLWSWWKWT